MTLEDRYDRLKVDWLSATFGMFLNERLNHPSFQAIVDLGEPVLPVVFAILAHAVELSLGQTTELMIVGPLVERLCPAPRSDWRIPNGRWIDLANAWVVGAVRHGYLAGEPTPEYVRSLVYEDEREANTQ